MLIRPAGMLVASATVLCTGWCSASSLLRLQAYLGVNRKSTEHTWRIANASAVAPMASKLLSSHPRNSQRHPLM